MAAGGPLKTAEEIARAYWRAEESRDTDRILAFFAPDAQWRGPGVERRGSDEIRSIYADSAMAYPELAVEVIRVVGDGDEAALEYRALFRDRDGNEHRLNGVNLIRTDGERIVSLTTYFDPAQIDPAARGAAPR
jgi:uncharacterized protein (TIGR02246 family)